MTPAGSAPNTRQRKVRRAAGAAVVVALAGAAFLSLRGGIFARPVSADLKDGRVSAGAGDDGFIDVPGEAPSLQGAIDAASEGATIRLGPGAFKGGATLGARSVRIQGAGAARTTIRGMGHGPVLTVNAAAGANVGISGVTLSGGQGKEGAGLLVTAGSVEIRDTWFRGNEGSGAVVRDKGRPVFADCTFRDNRSSFAGGALCNFGGKVLLVSCSFDANSALTFGGAVYSEGGSVETLACTFADNFTTSGAFGGALYSQDSKLQLTRSDFLNNESRDAGGAMYLRGGAADIDGCKFSGNRAEGAWALYSMGAGVRMHGSTLCGDADKLLGGDLRSGTGNAFDASCFPDCNNNGISDAVEVMRGWVQDMDGNGTPDECDLDCNANQIPDSYEISSGLAQDLNGNGVIDMCEIRMGFTSDVNHDLVPDEVPARRIKAKAEEDKAASSPERTNPLSVLKRR